MLKIEITGRDIALLLIGAVIGFVLSGNVVITESMITAFFSVVALLIAAIFVGFMAS